jgi:hypothetical protein
MNLIQSNYPQPTKRQSQKWANALRSGKFKQGKHKLEDEYGNLCCLGVGCKIFTPRNLQKVKYETSRLAGVDPIEQQHAPQWLKTIDLDLFRKSNYHFTDLNDSLNYTFNEIADIIELMYVHRILD